MEIPIDYPVDELGKNYLVSKINRMIPQNKGIFYNKQKKVFKVVLNGQLKFSEREIIKQINQAANHYVSTKYIYLNDYPEVAKKKVSHYGYIVDSIGNITLSDHALAIFEDFSAIFNTIEDEIPKDLTTPFISIDTLKKTNYDENFPQNFNLVSNADKGMDKIATAPAACYHIYKKLENQILVEFSKYSITGICFRCEDRFSDYRLGSFHMHEIVFFGSMEEVEAYRQGLINKVWQIFMKLGFSGQIEIAADPFFTNSVNKQEVQIDSKIKFELIGKIEGENIAIASFNIHNNHFSKSFNILYGDSYANSGCVAFGIERWVYLFLVMYGETDKLPSEMIEE